MSGPLLQEPAAVFLTIMAVILVAPLLSERVRLPGIVGLIVAGTIIGRHGLHLLATDRIIELFGEIGLIYLMFNAGLEIDIAQLRDRQKLTLGFGSLSFALPLASGIVVGRFFGLGWAAAVLLGSLYASQTLIAYPLVRSLGIIRNEAVAVTVGATVFTDICALLVLAVIVGSPGGLSLVVLLRMVGLALAYTMLILFAVPRLGRRFFRRFSGRTVEFQFVLVVLFVAAVLAEQIGMHTIVGAFLAGLAINATLPKESKTVNQVIFVGESFFVPVFLMTVGMRLDLPAIVTDMRTVALGLAMTGATYLTKYAAVWVIARVRDYSRDELMTSWGLSQAQAAATLAAVLVGVEAEVFAADVLDATILMVLLTSLSSPVIVDRFGQRIEATDGRDDDQPLLGRVLVPVVRDEPPEHEIDFAELLALSGDGKVLVLNLAADESVLRQRRVHLQARFRGEPESEIEPLDRIEQSIPSGVLNAVVEEEASLVVMPWEEAVEDEECLLIQCMDRVLEQAAAPVLAVHLETPIKGAERVLIAAPEGLHRETTEAPWARTLGALANSLQLPVTVVSQVEDVDPIRCCLSDEQERSMEVVLASSDLAERTREEARNDDLVIVPALRGGEGPSGLEQRIAAMLHEKTRISFMVLHAPAAAEETGKAAD